MSDPTSSLDHFFDDDEDELDITNALYIGEYENYNKLLDMNTGSELSILYLDDQDSMGINLLNNSYAVVFIEDDDNDIIQLSNTIHLSQPLCRIVLVTSNKDVVEFTKIKNYGVIHAIITTPFEEGMVQKTLFEQEARYTIAKSVTQFVKEPPKLSKASFLLLDPTLPIDENLPLNFVGVMITASTVPQYSIFFEEALAQDEFLFAGYLSSITALGDDLFNNKETLKEINFGGISVIFRFYENLQFSFLVRNLTQKNVEIAEKFISDIVNSILALHEEELVNIRVDNQTVESINQIMRNIEKLNKNTHASIEDQNKFENHLDTHYILLFAKDQDFAINFIKQFKEIELDVDFKYEFDYCTTEEEVINRINQDKYSVLFIDSKRNNGEKRILEQSILFSETALLLQIILIERNEKFTDDFVNGINMGRIDYVIPYNYTIEEVKPILEKSLKIAYENKLKSKLSEGHQTNNLAVAKAILREHWEDYSDEETPIFHGIIISKGLEIIYDKFWPVEGISTQFDSSMLAGLVTSLKSIAGEMFNETETVNTIDIKGSTVFVQTLGEYMFTFFVKNANTSIEKIVSNEVAEISKLYMEIIDEAGDFISMAQLMPIFNDIAERIKISFTNLLTSK